MSDIEQNEASKEQAPALFSDAAIPPEKKATLSNILDYVEVFVIAVCFVIILFSFTGIRLCTVSGPSMEKTLYNNEKLVTSDIFYTPERNDIVVFHQTGDHSFNEPIVKRVIGVAGDTVTVEYEDNDVIVTVTDSKGNVTVLEEDYKYIDEKSYNPYPLPTTITVETGTVFVMGDNRHNSADSRDARIGLVDTRRILGKVIFRISPFSRFGIVK